MNEIKNINLNDDDFKLIIEALEALPNKFDFGELMGDLLVSALKENNKDDQALIDSKVEEKKQILKDEKIQLKQKSVMVMSKIFMLRDVLLSDK